MVVYIDLHGAFDKVWIDGLLYKLAQAGLSGAMSQWLHAYLTSCSACVSEWSAIRFTSLVGRGAPGSCVESSSFQSYFNGCSTARRH